MTGGVVDRENAGYEPEGTDIDETPAEVLASKLIDAWVADKGRKISWRRAIEIVAIITKQPQAEVDRLLALGADDDGRCEMCGQPLAAPPQPHG